jgi:hypothetical protein
MEYSYWSSIVRSQTSSISTKYIINLKDNQAMDIMVKELFEKYNLVVDIHKISHHQFSLIIIEPIIIFITSLLIALTLQIVNSKNGVEISNIKKNFIIFYIHGLGNKIKPIVILSYSLFLSLLILLSWLIITITFLVLNNYFIISYSSFFDVILRNLILVVGINVITFSLILLLLNKSLNDTISQLEFDGINSLEN